MPRGMLWHEDHARSIVSEWLRTPSVHRVASSCVKTCVAPLMTVTRSLVCSGNVDETMRESGEVAQAFARLYSGWINQWLNKAPSPQRDPRTANVRVHLSSTSDTKQGRSAGAAVAGECVGGKSGRVEAGRFPSLSPMPTCLTICPLSWLLLMLRGVWQWR